ncbi:MAG: carboxypeptidase-like regulatory domain-containing protein, partial [Pirellula sp.]
MRFGLRSKSFVAAFGLAMASGLTFGMQSGVFADETIPAVKATEASPYLNQLFSKQWVRLSSDNSISGSLVQLSDEDKNVLAGLPVALVRDGQVAYRSKADASGAFRFSGVEVGSYSLVARTNESIAAFSLQVLDASNKHLTSEVEVRVIRPAGNKVKEILRAQALPTYAVRSTPVATIEKDPLESSRSFSKSHVVKADSQGNLVGQLGAVGTASDLSEMQVYVLKDGQEVAKTRADKNGKFTFEGLAPGVYGFIAAGNSGFAATSFQLINASIASSKADDGSRYISIFGNACNQMNVEVVQCSEVVACEAAPVQVVQESIVEAPIVETCGEMVVDECGAAPCG